MNKTKKCKICHITTVHRLSDARIFDKECKSLACAGYETILIVQNDAHTIIDGISIKALPETKERFTRISRFPWHIFKIILSEHPNVCHFHDPELIPLGLLCKIIGKKVIYDVHEDYPLSLLSNNRAWIRPKWRNFFSFCVSFFERLGGRYFDGIITATPTIANHFPPSKTITIRNYPILNKLSAINSASRNSEQPQVIYMGNLSAVRGISEMIRAVEIAAPFTGVRLAIAGLFDSHSYEEYIKNLKGWQHVDFLGWQSRDEIAKTLATSRIGLVVIHPMQEYLSSYPTKIFEYMRAGLPVIASDFPLWRNFVSKVGCGLLVDPLNPEDIAEAIIWLIKNPQEAENMGKRGMKAVKEKYNWDMEKKKLLTFYEKILA